MRKAILLAMAAAAIAMFVAPGSASANWTKEHKSITANQEVEITGTDMLFTGEAGGITCEATISKVTFVPTPGQSTIKTFETHPPSKCKPLAPLAHCVFTDFTSFPTPGGTGPEDLEWPVHTTGADTVTITSGTIKNDLHGFLCPDTELTPGSVTMTVASGETTTTSTATLSGTLKADKPEMNVKVEGTVHLLGPLLYGI